MQIFPLSLRCVLAPEAILVIGDRQHRGARDDLRDVAGERRPARRPHGCPRTGTEDKGCRMIRLCRDINVASVLLMNKDAKFDTCLCHHRQMSSLCRGDMTQRNRPHVEWRVATKLRKLRAPKLELCLPFFISQYEESIG